MVPACSNGCPEVRPVLPDPCLSCHCQVNVMDITTMSAAPAPRAPLEPPSGAPKGYMGMGVRAAPPPHRGMAMGPPLSSRDNKDLMGRLPEAVLNGRNRLQNNQCK